MIGVSFALFTCLVRLNQEHRPPPPHLFFSNFPSVSLISISTMFIW
jgi:hypothetical protein